MKTYLISFTDGTFTYIKASSLVLLDKILNKEHIKKITLA